MKCHIIGLVMLALCASGCAGREVVPSVDGFMSCPQEELIKKLKAASLQEDNDTVAKIIIAMGLTAEWTPEVRDAVLEVARTDAPVPNGVDWPDGLPEVWRGPTGQIYAVTPRTYA